MTTYWITRTGSYTYDAEGTKATAAFENIGIERRFGWNRKDVITNCMNSARQTILVDHYCDDAGRDRFDVWTAVFSVADEDNPYPEWYNIEDGSSTFFLTRCEKLGTTYIGTDPDGERGVLNGGWEMVASDIVAIMQEAHIHHKVAPEYRLRAAGAYRAALLEETENATKSLHQRIRSAAGESLPKSTSPRQGVMSPSAIARLVGLTRQAVSKIIDRSRATVDER